MAEQLAGQRPAANNAWQDMSLARLEELQAAGERGDYAELQSFYDFMEGADPIIKAVIKQRRDALCACGWEVRPLVPQGLEAIGKQVDFLRDAYERVLNLAEAVAFLSSALFRGFAHLQKVFTMDGMVLRLDPVPQWCWAWDAMHGTWRHNEQFGSGCLSGVAMDYGKFVLLESTSLNRVVSVLYVRKTLCKKEWYDFLNSCGLPTVYTMDGPGAPAEGDGTGVGDPAGTGEVLCPVRGGRLAPFAERIERFDRLLVLAMTRGLLASLPGLVTGPAGGASSQQVFRQLASEDAAVVSKVFQEQFDAPLLKKFFPGQPVLAQFVLVPA